MLHEVSACSVNYDADGLKFIFFACSIFMPGFTFRPDSVNKHAAMRKPARSDAKDGTDLVQSEKCKEHHY